LSWSANAGHPGDTFSSPTIGSHYNVYCGAYFNWDPHPSFAKGYGGLYCKSFEAA